jgi:predicted DCC family thiol-disulfide oxidoreductase YuxK
MSGEASMSEARNSPSTVTVCYDGACSLCQESVSRLQSLDRGRRIRWVAYQDLAETDPALARHLSTRDLGSALHVVETDGSIRSGAAGVLRIAEIVPRLRPFARLGRLPIVNRLVEPMYGLVARHRHRLSRWLGSGGPRAGSP